LQPSYCFLRALMFSGNNAVTEMKIARLPNPELFPTTDK